MRRTTIALLLGFAPAYVTAQSQEGQPENRPASESRPASGFSAEGRIQLEAMLQVARERQLPTEPMTDRMAEGRAKGASEARILVAMRRVQAELIASQEALIRAGRERPSDGEVVRGAQLIARGATSAQLEAFVRRAPSERRLEVALEVLGELAARGLPVDRALAVVGAQLTGGTSDRHLVSLTASATGQAHGSAAGSAAAGSGATTAGGSASGSAGARTGGSTSVGIGSQALGATLTGAASGKVGVGLPGRP